LTHRLFFATALLTGLAVTGCVNEPVIDDDMLRVEGPLPADFSGSWERDWTRGNDVDGAFTIAYQQLARTTPDRQLDPDTGRSMPSQRDVNELVAAARLVEMITRPDLLTISQTEHEIRIERKDDYSLQCNFYNGMSKPLESGYGTEICGWDGDNLVSNLVLADKLQVTYRFTVSADRKQMRVMTTVKSPSARVPVTITHFYSRFDRLPPDYNCIETLSMKRVCGAGVAAP